MTDNFNLIPRPYTDWKGMLDLVKADGNPSIAVTKLFCSALNLTTHTDRIYDVNEEPVEVTLLKNTPFLTLEEVRKLVTVHLVGVLQTRFSRQNRNIMNFTGVNNTLLSKWITCLKDTAPLSYRTLPDGQKRLCVPEDIRPFTSPYDTLPGIADYIFNTTVQDMMFGDSTPIVLPHFYNCVVVKLGNSSGREKTRLIKLGEQYKKEILNSYCEKHDIGIPPATAVNYSCFRPDYEIIQERLLEMSWDTPEVSARRYIFFPDNFGSLKLRRAISGAQTGRYPGTKLDEKKPYYLPGLEYPMLWSLLSRTRPDIGIKALDYFVANDYIRVDGGVSSTPLSSPPQILLKTKNSVETVPIEDMDTLRILSYCVSFPKNEKLRYMSDIIQH